MDIELFILVIEIIGTIAFAISGALIAIENKMDILGVIILGSTTAVGGGLIRDLIINKDIPTLFVNPISVIVAACTTIIVFVTMYFLKDFKIIDTKAYRIVFNLVDSLGLGVFVVLGANITMSLASATPFLIIFNSVLTAVGGGMLRDIMACRIPVIFRKHIYAFAAILGAVFFYLVVKLNGWYPFAVIGTVVLVVVIRYLAFHFKLNLPRVKMHTED